VLKNTLKAEFVNGSQFLPYAYIDIFADDNGNFMTVFLKEYEREVKRWENPLHFLE
jgi:hypothetical protein